MSYPILKVGSKGDAVLQLKYMLGAKGFDRYRGGSTDPNFYPTTAEDVGVFQATHLGPSGKFLSQEPGVVVGEVGEMTWAVLEGSVPQRQNAPVIKAIPSTESPRRKLLDVMAQWKLQNVREIPKGSNADNGGVIDKMQRYHGLSGAPWCNMAANYAHHLAFGAPPKAWAKCARVCTTWNLARRARLTFRRGEDTPCPGDFAILVHGGLNRDGSAPDANGHLWTVSGCDGDTIYGLEGNSDDRFRASVRNIREAMGFIRIFDVERFGTADWGEYQAGNFSDR